MATKYHLAAVVVILLSGVATARAATICPNCGRVHAKQQATGGDVVAAWGNPALIQQALASARYRAARGIRGHSPHDTSMRGFRRSGVGWGTSRTPRTCYWEHSRNPNAAYVSVRGRGGYYSTLLIR